eukprot:230732-Heterocapsa_arctica.AAC.1
MKARRDLTRFNPKRKYMGTGAPEGCNPFGKDGKRMLCLLCGSDQQFMPDCPRKTATEAGDQFFTILM